MNIPKFMKRLLYWSIGIGLVILIITAFFVRDYHFIVQHPYYFLIEVLVFSIVPSLVVLILIKTRELPVKESLFWFLILAGKFALFHIVTQLSGIYKEILGR
jgi:hypothetical protein